MRALLVAALLSIGVPLDLPPEPTPEQIREDFAAFVSGVKATYAYFDVKATRWDDIAKLYEPDVRRARSRQEFIELLESAIAELYDDHAHLTGEGLAIGFDGVGRATVVGGPMAQLLGATYRIELPNTKIGVSLPAERLYHVNGSPREAFRPKVAVRAGGSADHDEVLKAGVKAVSSAPRGVEP